VDTFINNQRFKFSKPYHFNKGKSSLMPSLGYDRKAGWGLGGTGNHQFGSTKLSGSFFKTQNAGTNYGFGLKQNFGKFNLQGKYGWNNKFGLKQQKYGIGYNFNKNTELSLTHKRNNFGSRSTSLNFKKTFGNKGPRLSVGVGKNNAGTFGQVGFGFDFRKK